MPDEITNDRAQQRAERIERRDAKKLQQLNARINALATACRLSDEILIKIFFQTKALYPKRVPGTGYTLLWIRVTHVCQSWREVALACTKLWTDLDFGNPGLTAAMLHRAQSAPLSLNLSDEQYPGDRLSAAWSICRRILSQVDRLRSVNLETTRHSANHAKVSSSFFKTIASKWATAADKLEELSLSPSTPLEEEKDFMPHGAPNLQRLSLIDCYIPLSKIPIGPRITHLTIHETPVMFNTPKSCLPSTTELGEAVQGMPLLQHLDLRYGNGPFKNIKFPDLAAYRAPSITSLHIQAAYLDVGLFFRAFRCPNLTTLIVKFSIANTKQSYALNTLPGSMQEIRDFLQDERPKGGRTPAFAHPCHLALRSEAGGSAVLSTWFKDAACGIKTSPPNASITFMSESVQPRSWIRTLELYHDCYGLSTIRTFSYHDYTQPAAAPAIGRIPFNYNNNYILQGPETVGLRSMRQGDFQAMWVCFNSPLRELRTVTLSLADGMTLVSFLQSLVPHRKIYFQMIPDEVLKALNRHRDYGSTAPPDGYLTSVSKLVLKGQFKLDYDLQTGGCEHLATLLQRLPPQITEVEMVQAPGITREDFKHIAAAVPEGVNVIWNGERYKSKTLAEGPDESSDDTEERVEVGE